jgi:pimeloyl-[acyl-carrier protein] synthase
VRLGDLTIPAGRLVILCIGAANHDPSAFENPSRLDLGRSPNPHLAFAAGPHFCIGAPPARAEAGVAIPAIVRRFPSLRTETRTPQWRPSFTVRGLTALQLTC